MSSGNKSLSWEESAAKIEQTLRSLRVQMPPENRAAIPIERLIPGFVRELMHIAHSSNSIRPYDKVNSRSAADKELKDLGQAAKKLLDKVEGLHRPAIDALIYRDYWWNRFRTDLRVLVVAAEHAEISDVDPKSGRDENIMPFKIALKLATLYEALTGYVPTRRTNAMSNEAYGPYLNLVSAVFETLEIDANPEYYARKALESDRAPFP